MTRPKFSAARASNTLRLFQREAQTRPRVLAIGLHPHLIGVPHRFESLERMLDLLMKTPNVCFMTGETMAAWYAAQVPPSAA
jgi:allantoinase